MVDPQRVLQPLTEVEGRLDAAAGAAAAERAAAVDAAIAVIERALRLLMRSDTSAPDETRLAALSPADMPRDRLVEALRRHDLVSLELAGMAHELFRRTGRDDADRAEAMELASAVVQRCRTEVLALGDRSVREVAHHAVAGRALEAEPHEVAPPTTTSWRPLALGGSAVVLLVIVAAIGILMMGRGPELAEPVSMFRAGELDRAEEGFLEVLDRNPDNVTALLYLGRIYRRQERYEDAARVLRQARDLAPRDDDVRRELGHLLMDLDRATAAAEQFRIAVEVDPDRALNWIGLVRAMRAAGDPRAEDMLHRAPAEARAVLARDS